MGLIFNSTEDLDEPIQVTTTLQLVVPELTRTTQIGVN